MNVVQQSPTLHQPLHSKVANYLNDQRRTGTFCDLKIELQAGGVSWGHFCVIGAQSEFIGGRHFRQKFLQFSIHNPLKVTIRNFTCAQCLQSIVDFFYEDVISIPSEHADHFRKLAKILCITELLQLFGIEDNDGNNESPAKQEINVIIENVFEQKQNYFKVKNPKATRSSKVNHCIGCEFKCYKVQEMINHMNICEYSNLSCSMCEIAFLTWRDFDDHLKKHSSDAGKPFFCIECGARFMTRAALLIHQPKHSIKTPYVCKKCSKAFKWKQGLKNHLLVHSEEKQMLCDICGYSTMHMKALKSHKLTHTGELFECTYAGCKHKTNRKENLKIHIETHKQERPFVCEICGYKFSQSKNLKRHALKHSADDTNRHKCQLCSFTSHRLDKVKEHTQRLHTEKAVQLELPEIVENAFETKDDVDVCPDLLMHTNPQTLKDNTEKLSANKISVKRKTRKKLVKCAEVKRIRQIAPKLPKDEESSIPLSNLPDTLNEHLGKTFKKRKRAIKLTSRSATIVKKDLDMKYKKEDPNTNSNLFPLTQKTDDSTIHSTDFPATLIKGNDYKVCTDRDFRINSNEFGINLQQNLEDILKL